MLKPNWRPWLGIKEIIDLEEEYCAKSTFFVLSLDSGDRDSSYHVEDIASELTEAVELGWEVGLHGGYGTYCNFERLLSEKRSLEGILGKGIAGYRSHYLQFKVPETWALLSRAGFSYDSTFGYADCVGFRNGMCHPFRPFDLNRSQEMSILEIPLHIMDVSLSQQYMQLPKDTLWILLQRISML
jgi:peptidoglycan/xylan/chitin deacetylase (PgdA/CDA1 family)